METTRIRKAEKRNSEEVKLRRLTKDDPESDTELIKELEAEEKIHQEVRDSRPKNRDVRVKEEETKAAKEHKGEDDTWELNDNFLIRHINTPRSHMYILKEDDCPIPIKYVDIQRRTETNLDAKAEPTMRLLDDG